MDIINPTMGASPRPLVTAAPVEKMTGTWPAFLTQLDAFAKYRGNFRDRKRWASGMVAPNALRAV
jgi:hypothetical protein